MTVKVLIPNRFVPTASRSGNGRNTIFRAVNGFIRGKGGNTYFECYGGSLDLNEEISADAITGTISFSPASKTISGVGTSFVNELHLGQKLITILGELIVVSSITDADTFIADELPLSTGSGVAAHRMPVLYEIDNARGTSLSGNVLQFDMGTLLGVGSGTFRRNGAAISSSLTLSKQAKIAIYDAATNTYLIQTLGFQSAPIGVTAAASTAPVAKTFTDADVNTGTDRVTITTHGFNNGQKALLSNAGGALPVTSPVGELADNVFIIRIDANTVQFGQTLADTVGTPVPINIASAAGGGTHTVTPISKVMPAGDRSIRVAKASTKLGTPSYGNPTEKIKVTLTAGQGIAITFPAMDSNSDPTDPHDAYRIYGSRFGGSTTTATAAADSGAWYYVRTVTAAELGGTAGGTYYLEYLDAEIDGNARLITFDNDYPRRAEFVGTVAGYPVLISCQGKGTADFPDGDAPGSSLVPFKPANIAAAPLVLDNQSRNEVPLSPPETIIGFYMATGRLYLLTANTLQIAVFTADTDFPVATRPFWKSGFKNPYALCFANDRLYGFTNAPIRSPEDGTDSNVDRDFAAEVKELTYDWNAARAHVVHDPLNECVCYVYSAAYKNDAGYWVSLIVPMSLDNNDAWQSKFIISSDDRDMIISGVATVNGHFEFLAGGRDGAGGIEVRTYRFDGGGGESVPWSIAWEFSDDQSENRPKKIKYPRPTGKFTNTTVGIHGTHPGEAVDVALLEAGNAGSKSGAIAVPNSTDITVYDRLDVAVAGLTTYTIQYSGVWSGAGVKDRLDESSHEVIIQGGRG